MKLIKSSRLLVMALLFLLSGSVFAHGVQLRWHIADNGNVRVWIEHWHGATSASGVSGFPLSVSVSINGAPATTTTYYADGVANGVTAANLPGPATTLLSECTSGSKPANSQNNWVYWDFAPPACNTPVELTIIAGLAVTTDEACSGLYPQTIVSTFADATGPVITANDITVGATMNCDSTAVASFGATAVDACSYASGGTLTYSLPEGSVFSLGSNPVTVTATDSMSNSTNKTFNVIVQADPYTGSNSDVVCSGDSYTFPDNHIVNNITSAFSYTWTIPRTNACDSTVNTSISVNPTYNQTQASNVCSGDSYTFPDGTSQSNITSQVIYTSNLTTVHTSCDSIIVSTVNVDPIYNQTNGYNVCNNGSYTFPDGAVVNNITADFIHTSNLTTVHTSCDSIIVDSIYVQPTYIQNNAYNVCYNGSYTFPDGAVVNNIITDFVHVSNLSTVGFGCDSTIVDSIYVQPVYNQTQLDTVCYNGSYTLPDGSTQNNILASFTHTNSLSTVGFSCDSTIVSNIHVIMPKYEVQYLTLCFNETYSIGSSTYGADGMYIDTISAVSGCDSIVTTHITVTEDLGQYVYAQLDTLIGVSIPGATYQWLECSNSYAAVSGENSVIMKIVNTGSYALETTKGACVDTSDCIQVDIVEDFPMVVKNGDKYNGVADKTGKKYVVVFEQDQPTLQYQLVNDGGVIILDITLQNADGFTIDMSIYPAGIYYLKVMADGPDHIAKIIN